LGPSAYQKSRWSCHDICQSDTVTEPTDPRPAPSAFVFDFDGTILDTEWPEYVIVAAEYQRHGLTLDLSEWQETIGTAGHPHWTDVLQSHVGPIDDIDEVRARSRARHRSMLAALDVQPGVHGLLDLAEDRGLALAVASSSPRSWVEEHLSHRGLIGRFATVVTRDDVAAPKPAPDLFALACRRLGIAPAHAVAFEDSRHGCAAATQAGLRCVVVPNRVTAGQDFSRADLVVGSLADLDAIQLGLSASVPM